MTRLTKHLMVLRDRNLVEFWENNKSEITMIELAEIFKIALPRVYQILKENKTGSTTWKATATTKK